MDKLNNLLRTLFKIALPINVIIFPLIAIYGTVKPWAPGKEVLDKYVNENPIMVGASYNKNTVNGIKTINQSRSYILIPSVFNDPKLISINTVNSKSLEIRESKSSLIFLISWYLFCIIGTWWFWLRRNEKTKIT